MSNYKIVSKEEVSAHEVLDLINKKEKNAELTYREGKIQDYLNTNLKINLKKFKEALEELSSLDIPRLEKQHYFKILEIMPNNGTELRAIVSHSGVILVDENVKKIIDVLNKHRK
jgi:DNA-directed RNA polymerase subunit F